MVTSGPGGELDPALYAAWRELTRPALDLRTLWFETAEELQLTPAGLDALLKVDPDEPPSMRQLAERIGCDASFVTAMVDDLESAGYAERRPSAADRRVRNIALTEPGRRARAMAQRRLMAPPPQLGTLTPAEQRDLARLLLRAAADPDASPRGAGRLRGRRSSPGPAR